MTAKEAGGAGAVQLGFDELGTPLERVTFVVVDLETTGGAPGAEEITEIGSVKVCGGDVLGELQTLVNPGRPIPPFITTLTGITTAMVLPAPRIASVLPAFLEFLGDDRDTVLVAHNARFDVGHLKAACAAHGFEWPPVRVLDTVQLARRTFSRDEAPNVKLSTLARICNVSTPPSHRALDDARATVDVLHAMLARLGPLGVTHMEDLVHAVDPVPQARRRKVRLADGLPTDPGVYHFLGPAGDVLYVGSSVNLRSRVRQYFTAAEKRRRIGEMVDIATKVTVTTTHTELEARILELRDIMALDPPYNRRSKRPTSRPWIRLTKEPHPRLTAVTSLATPDVATSLGPFTSRSAANAAISVLAEVSQLRTCTRKLPARPRPDDPACHLYELGKCAAPCILDDVDQPAVEAVQSFLRQDATRLWEAASQRLRRLAADERFEQAAEQRDRVAALMRAKKRRERITPILLNSRIVAAREVEGAWDVIVVDWGRLVATARCDAASVTGVAETLTREHPVAAMPPVVGAHTHVEETEIIARWLTDPRARLLEVPAIPLATPRDSAARIALPEQDSRRWNDGDDR